MSEKKRTKIGGIEIIGIPKIVGVHDKQPCEECGCRATVSVMISIHIEGAMKSALEGLAKDALEHDAKLALLAEAAKIKGAKGIYTSCPACGQKGPLALALEARTDQPAHHALIQEGPIVEEVDVSKAEYEKAKPQAERDMEERGEDGAPKGTFSVPVPPAFDPPPLFKKKSWN